MAERLDLRVRHIPAFDEYLETYGYNINKSLFEYAVSLMQGRDGSRHKAIGNERVHDILKANNIELKRDKLHNAAYVFNMAMSDYMGSSITDEAHIAKFVKDYLDDPDGSETRAFDELYAKFVSLGIPVEWSDML